MNTLPLYYASSQIRAKAGGAASPPTRTTLRIKYSQVSIRSVALTIESALCSHNHVSAFLLQLRAISYQRGYLLCSAPSAWDPAGDLYVYSAVNTSRALHLGCISGPGGQHGGVLFQSVSVLAQVSRIKAKFHVHTSSDSGHRPDNLTRSIGTSSHATCLNQQVDPSTDMG